MDMVEVEAQEVDLLASQLYFSSVGDEATLYKLYSVVVEPPQL